MDQPLQQPVILLCFLYCGVIMGIVFGVLELLQAAVGRPFFLHLTDAAAVWILGGIFFLTMLKTTGGTLRLYPFLTCAVGFWIERNTFHTVLYPKRFKRIHK